MRLYLSEVHGTHVASHNVRAIHSKYEYNRNVACGATLSQIIKYGGRTRSLHLYCVFMRSVLQCFYCMSNFR